MKKTKYYLDSNELYGYFKSAIRAIGSRKPFIEPENIKKLKKRKNDEFYSSILVKCELLRRLKLEHENFTNEKFEKLWDKIRKLLNLRLIEEIKIDEIIYEEFVKKAVFKCRIQDIIHISLAIGLRAKFYTNDKNVKEAIKLLAMC